jgi:hypothetical protein
MGSESVSVDGTALFSGWARGEWTVSTARGHANLKCGEFSVIMSMESLQQLTCAAANVLDVWFTDREGRDAAAGDDRE